MGASGSAWIKPKKRQGLRADAITDVPHPRAVRPGQRYFPLDPRSNSRVTVCVTRASESCQARREDVKRALVRVTAKRLLATREDGSGRHYRFVGFAARSYQTHVAVVDVAGSWVRVVCPEWHPGLAITVAAGAVDPAHRTPGSWLACRADLAADSPSRVQPRGFTLPAAGFDPDRYHPLALDAEAAEPLFVAPPETGPGCGDVVLFVSESELDEAVRGTGVYMTGHPPPALAGGRAYLHTGGRVIGWRSAGGEQRLPNGMRLLLEGGLHPIEAPATPSLPASGVMGGEHGRQLWQWRTWSREQERDVTEPSRS